MFSRESWAPAHITGFFSAPEINSTHPQDLGSLGAGFSLDVGTETTIKSHPSDKIELKPNPGSQPIVSRTALELFRDRHICNGEKLEIVQEISAPQGSGFGTSGSGAFSLVLSLNKYYGSPLQEDEVAALAHEAEILCKTGLGTVAGQYAGGFEIRIKPGYPNKNTVLNFGDPEEWRALIYLLGPLSTRKKLSDMALRKRINHSGEHLLKKLLAGPTVENFLSLSADFTNEVGLLTTELKRIRSILNSNGYQSAQLMFGEGLFTLVPPSEAKMVENLLTQQGKKGEVFNRVIIPGRLNP